MTEKTMTSSLSGYAARGSIIVMLSQALRIATQFASIFLLARLLDPKDYGYLAMVMSVIGVAELLRDFGLSAAAVQSRDLSGQQQSNLFWLNAMIGLGASLAVACASPAIAALYGEPELVPITLALAPIFFLNGLSTQFRAHINRGMHFFRLSFTDVVPQIFAFGAAVTVATFTGSYVALIVQQISIAVVGLGLAIALSDWFPGWPKRGTSVHGHVRFGANLFFTNLLTYGTNNFPMIMVGAVWGPSQLGYFSRAYQLMALPLTQVMAPMTKVALPVLSKVQDEPKRYTDIIGRAQLLGLYITTPVFLLCSTMAEPMIKVALGDQWMASAPIFALLALGGAFRSMSQLAYWMFLSSDSTRQQFVFNAWALPAIVVLMAAGLPWGGLGVAAGHTVGYALYLPASMLVASRAAGVPRRPLTTTAARVFGLLGSGVAGVGYASTFVPVLPVLQILIGVLGAGAWAFGITMATPTGRRDLMVLRAFASAAK
ncbi:lipopolysaccharide biosynthesis protein [Kocuria flava]|uniref:lipopolysaccharide biosynthesis protein n=1 Tax=Kocuria flava TaxID=446860 RepID=UPI001FF1CF5F|nr:lipopolysaccharide biosynthesis protein [Kocuria flava]MCJ8504804.1 lipopolysaccharide biosynthesis protein [Kocuria flava]